MGAKNLPAYEPIAKSPKPKSKSHETREPHAPAARRTLPQHRRSSGAWLHSLPTMAAFQTEKRPSEGCAGLAGLGDVSGGGFRRSCPAPEESVGAR
jgi:hypothetical protein